jgi:hypothetical protein
MAPSDPDTIPCGSAFCVGIEYSVISRMLLKIFYETISALDSIIENIHYIGHLTNELSGLFDYDKFSSN